MFEVSVGLMHRTNAMQAYVCVCDVQGDVTQQTIRDR